jgi:hypothetical protein
MPWTFAHPAAVIALRRYCPRPLSFPALVIGSIAPDLGYHLRMTSLAHYAHSAEGSLLVCLPAGLLLLAVLYLVRKPIWYLLPQPHRSALAPMVAADVPLRPSALLVAGASILIGAWTHIAWDALTHNNGWLVLRLGLLQAPLFFAGGVEVRVFNVLQQVSTCLGIAVIAVVYWRWLQRTGDAAALRYFHRDDVWRYLALAAFAVAAILIAVTIATLAAVKFQGYYAWSAFLFRGAVDGMSAFVVLYLSCSVLCYYTRRTA